MKTKTREHNEKIAKQEEVLKSQEQQGKISTNDAYKKQQAALADKHHDVKEIKEQPALYFKKAKENIQKSDEKGDE